LTLWRRDVRRRSDAMTKVLICEQRERAIAGMLRDLLFGLGI
jgi:hypothetical protein